MAEYLSRFIVCTRCDREKAEYTYQPTKWDNQYICRKCAEYLAEKGLIVLDNSEEENTL